MLQLEMIKDFNSLSFTMLLNKPSKNVESASSSSKAKATTRTTPTSLSSNQITLSYQAKDQEEWVSLPYIENAKRNDVGPIVFDGSISITQKIRGNRCIAKLARQDYSLESLEIDDEDESTFIIGIFQCLQTPVFF